ncbi:MAG TPA: transglutaminase-like domain-containing protein, partial [Acidimicrobiia bacterium]|nr:transglutaminase-like domain-containing protein [Acidimicrobiia bacterium]
TGYCEQFAAAMAVMARTIKIPSRVVWGFTPGEVVEDEQGEVVVVRERNAHAWVELWIEPVGWVMFDPTPRRELDGYNLQPESITTAFNPDEYVSEDLADGLTPGAPEEFIAPNLPEAFEQGGTVPTGAGPNWWLIGLFALVPLAATIPLTKRLRRRRRLQRIREVGDVTAAWDEIVDRLDDLGDPMQSSLTPIEVARARDPALMPLATSYAAAIYGGREGRARESDFFSAELWLDQSYDARRRARAALSVRSLFRR